MRNDILMLFLALFWVMSIIVIGQKDLDSKREVVIIKTVRDTIEVPIKPNMISIKRATRYNPVKSQCDSDPLTTADNSKINLKKLRKGEIRWCALSRDLLKRWGGDFNYGDTIFVYSESTPIVSGWWVIHDTMNRRYKNSMDFLLPKNSYKFGVIKDLKIINNF